MASTASVQAEPFTPAEVAFEDALQVEGHPEQEEVVVPGPGGSCEILVDRPVVEDRADDEDLEGEHRGQGWQDPEAATHQVGAGAVVLHRAGDEQAAQDEEHRQTDVARVVADETEQRISRRAGQGPAMPDQDRECREQPQEVEVVAALQAGFDLGHRRTCSSACGRQYAPLRESRAGIVMKSTTRSFQKDQCRTYHASRATRRP